MGAMHSVNACMTNNGGTVLNMSSINSILGLEPHGVRVQAGCKMADIYDFLAQHVSHQGAAAVGGGCQAGTPPRAHGGGGGGLEEGDVLHSRRIRIEHPQLLSRALAAGTSTATGVVMLWEMFGCGQQQVAPFWQFMGQIPAVCSL